MTTVELYTPLEAFLFFQSLRSYGIQLSSFVKISDALKQNEFIQESNNHDHERFEPESLKRFYLELLKNEIRGEKLREASPSKDSDQNPKKRKLSTPPLDSIDGATEHEHLLPQLVNRLYAQYRDHVISAVHEEERKIKLLQKDILEIERGEWDERLQTQEVTSRRDSKGVSSIQTLLRTDADDDIQGGVPGRDRSEVINLQSGVSHGQDAAIQHDTNGYPRPIHLASDSTNRLSEGNLHQSRIPPASAVMPTYSPKPDSYQGISRPSSQSRMDGHSTYLPPIGGPVLSPTLDTNRRLPHPTPPIVPPPLSSPGLSNSPIILPPPPGMLRSSGSPAGPLDALADMAGQQYRQNPNVHSPRQTQFYSPQSRPNQLPQPRSFMQRSYPYYENQVPYAQHYPQYGQSPLPPYQSPSQAQYPPSASPSGYWSGPRQNGVPQYQSPLPSYPQFAGYPPGQAGFQQSPQVPPLHSPQNARLPVHTPLSVASRRQAHRPSPIDTSVSSTKWKRVSLPDSDLVPRSPSPPGPEAVSPISERAASPQREELEHEGILGRHTVRNRASLQNPKPEDDSGYTRGKGNVRGPRGGRSRGGNSRGRGIRAGSAASSALDVSARTATRSQSIVSHSDELSFDNTHGSTRKIKPEPPATPAAATDDIASIRSTPAGDPVRSSGRTRRDTIDLEPAQSTRPFTKRKRADTIENTPDLPTPSALNRPNHVLASRNFSRTSATIMNNITTHKLASMFAKPLTEREAPGYKDVIYRPQDLKSIKSAIGFGSRALAAMDDTGSPAIGGTKGSATIWVEKTSEIMPPKGIVNSAQLEKEVCRIFANAVMFNPDPNHGLGPAFRTRSRLVAAGRGDGIEKSMLMEEDDGSRVVRDTREMFDTVEKSVSNWRSADRTGEDGRARLRGGEDLGEGSEVDELAGDEGTEEEGMGSAKRRRKG